ncbi:hypothetical protein QJS10_CPB14g01163 [Acorus calamus]|uniref:Uncharacterized protein n=1 Tax=Acorus calamus TaxID=4465 RepID=A0AAV9DB48_ACOCL|nr:hypothetical protein QJS10_CPB14g01163 [Acorus calamus]
MTKEMAAHSNSRMGELFRDGGAKGRDDGAGGAHSTESAPSHEPVHPSINVVVIADPEIRRRMSSIRSRGAFGEI